MCLMGNSCGQFNEVTTIKNRMIVNSDRLVSGAYLQNFLKSLKNQIFNIFPMVLISIYNHHITRGLL